MSAVAARHNEIGEALGRLDDEALRAPSLLPDWDRLTILCHLRYGAMASHRMTGEARAGSPTAFYPEGRTSQRPATLRPADRETARDVVASLAEESRRLDDLWRAVGDDEWPLEVTEPASNPDLGNVSLWILALLRLTEVEVHGLDLDLDLRPWSTTFVAAALPMRLQWLATRRPNPNQADYAIDGTWLLRATDGPSYTVRATGPHVEVDTAVGTDGAVGDSLGPAGAAIIGGQSELLAFILGRRELGSLRIDGDAELAQRFLGAFPGP